MSDSDFPPGLEDETMFCGFHAVKWEFLHTPIFDRQNLSMTQSTMNLGGGPLKYGIPTGMDVTIADQSASTDTLFFRGVHCMKEDKFTSSIAASLSIGTFSASASQKLMTFSHIETDDTKITASKAAYRVSYTFDRGEIVGKLTSDFKAALTALPLTYSSADHSKFERFFDCWGTHYLSRGSFGGDWIMKSVIEKRVFDTLNEKEFETRLEAKFDAVTNKGAVKATADSDSKKSERKVFESTAITYKSFGGNGSPDYNNWVQSVDKSPVLLIDAFAMTDAATRPVFTPIWQLADESGGSASGLKEAWTAFLPHEKQQLDLTIPQEISIHVNTIMHADTDGFLSATIGITNEEDIGKICAFTDTDDTPKRRTASAAVRRSSTYLSQKIDQSSLFTPVQRNVNYRVSYTSYCGKLNTTSTFQPFPLSLGAWETLLPDDTYKFEQDGFVVAAIDAGPDMSAGCIVGSQKLNGTLKEIAGSSVGLFSNHSNVITASFCMPVLKSTEFRVNLIRRGGFSPVTASLFWIPIGSEYRFQPLVPLQPNNWYPANTHGFLIGFISQQDQPADGWPPSSFPSILTIHTAPTADDPDAKTVGVATVQNCSTLGQLFPCNSVTAVILKDSRYRASTTSQFNGYSSAISWVGVVPA